MGKLLQERLQKHSDEPEYIRSKASLELFRGNVEQARALLKTLIDSGKASTSDLNQFAWFALQPPAKVDQDAVEAAERANSLTQNTNFGIMHTLACLYAEQGKTKEARELLLKAMDVSALPEPNSSVWFALGQIAEQYGEASAARAIYARVEKSDFEVPGTSYAMAQQRLAVLKSAATTEAKTAGK
jgi:tetratricopeptide (TPR) repeat protein